MKQDNQTRAGAERSRNDALLRALLKLSRTGSFFWNVTTGELELSDEACCLLGYETSVSPTLELLISQTHPEDAVVLRQLQNQATEDRQDLEFEFRHAIPDGGMKYLRAAASVLPGEMDLLFVGAISDITEHKLWEERGRYAESHLRAIVDTIPAIVWSTKRDGSNDFHNQRLLDYTGFTPQDAAGSGWLKMVHPDDSERHSIAWHTAVATGAVFECESRLRRFDGEYRWFLARAEPYRDEQGQIIKWYGTNVDIHDRKKTEQALQRSEAYLAEAQRLSRTGSFGWNASTDEIFYWSDEVYRIFGYDPAGHLVAGEVIQRIHPDDIARVKPLLNGAADWQNFEFQCRLLIPSGEVKHIHVMAHAVPSGSNDIHFLGAVSDITERVTGQEALNDLQAKFAHASRVSVLGELTASIAHEISQPLAAIAANGQAGLQWMDRGEPDLKEVRTVIANIVSNARRAADIVARIRSMATRTTPQHVELSIDDVIREALVFLRYEVQARDAQIVHFTAPTAPVVLGDRTQLQQVLVNLVVNAMQASAQSVDRKITIRTKIEAENVVCSVEDNGTGIETEHLPKVFESFFTTKDGGMGMGLPLCQSILQSHGGDISAQNHRDGGAYVSFTIPWQGYRPDSN